MLDSVSLAGLHRFYAHFLMRKAECAILISDLHCGSTRGILPRGCKTLEGQTIGLNRLQSWMIQTWDAMSQRVLKHIGNAAYDLYLVGDLIDGNHHGTKQINTPRIKDQVNAAVSLIQPLSYRAQKRYVICGTECHVQDDENDIAMRIDAQPIEDGIFTWPRLDIKINGVQASFRHHIGTSSRAWSDSARLANNLCDEQLQAARHGYEMPRMVIAGHSHGYAHYSTGKEFVTVLPAWQGLTTFAYKVVPAAQTTVGMTILDWRKKRIGELPDVIPFLATAPKFTQSNL